VCESLMARVKRTNSSAPDRYVASALNTIITFNSDRMRIYDFYVLLLWIENSLVLFFFFRKKGKFVLSSSTLSVKYLSPHLTDFIVCILTNRIAHNKIPV
jgi:hypothetical protein